MPGLSQGRHALAALALALAGAGCGTTHSTWDLRTFLARVAPDARNGFARERGAVAPVTVHGRHPYFFRSSTPMPELFRFCLVHDASAKGPAFIDCRIRDSGDAQSTAATAAKQIRSALPAGYREAGGPVDATFPSVVRWLPASPGLARFSLIARRGGVTLHIH